MWLGGAALALGGAFLVKLSIDYGLLTPAVRVVLAALLGIALAGGAEWLRRREPGDATPPMSRRRWRRPARRRCSPRFTRRTAYGLLPSGIAFALLAVTAGAAVGLSLRHGPLVAALGLVGAYVVPLLVESDAPHALPLFAYLAVVTAASLALLRHRAWWWLVWFSLWARCCGCRCGSRPLPIPRRRQSPSICWFSSGCSWRCATASLALRSSKGQPTRRWSGRRCAPRSGRWPGGCCWWRMSITSA